MPPKKTPVEPTNDGDDLSTKLTPSEIKLFTAMMANMISAPECDWDKVAEAVGSASSESVRVRYRQIKKKFGWDTPTVKTASVKKGKNSSAAASAPETPTKVTKATGRVGTKKGQKTLPPTMNSTQNPALAIADNIVAEPTLPTTSPDATAMVPAAMVPLDQFMGGDFGWVEYNGEDRSV